MSDDASSEDLTFRYNQEPAQFGVGHEISRDAGLAQFPTLAASRSWSLNKLGQLTKSFTQVADQLEPITLIAAAGSLGRLEANVASDVDCVLLQRAGCDDAAVLDASARVMSIIEQAGLKAPKSDGIYRRAHTLDALCTPAALGNLAELPELFGKRIQLLLDTKPLFGHCEFVIARQRVLEWYLSAGRMFEFEDDWDFLARDLTRYAHSYWNWQLFKLDNTADDSWFLRQAKLRSSRLLTWFGLWALLNGVGERGRGSTWLNENLDCTPLERIALVFGKVAQPEFQQLLGAYENILASLADPVVRNVLLQQQPTYAGYSAGELPEFDRIIAESNVIRRCLRRFIEIGIQTSNGRSNSIGYTVF